MTWSPGVNNGGTPVIDYTLSRSTDGGTTYAIILSGILITSFTDTSVTMGTTYYYEV